MNKTVSLKKAVTLITAISMILCMIGSFGFVTADAATDKVSMYSSEVYFSKYGITNRIIYIKTNSNASNQQVTVHYNYLKGEAWRDAEATVFTTLSDGSKLWKASINTYNCEYAIKFTEDGRTTWDNNNGKNYKGDMLGTAPITVNRGGYPSYYNYRITATLQNYAYEKNVVLRYTTDNWASYTDVAMSYAETNANGTENWKADLSGLPKDLSGFEYCVSYTVNGTTYWANNFGENYDQNYRVYP